MVYLKTDYLKTAKAKSAKVKSTKASNDHLKTLLTSLVIALGMSSSVHAEQQAAQSWTLEGGGSKIAFGSIKSESIGEAHSFTGLSGSVAPDGSVAVDIDLSSVETNIDIRNERMIEHVFKSTPNASLSAQIDMAKVTGLAVGDTAILEVDGALSFIGASVDVETKMFVARLSEDKVIVTTNDMIFVGTEDIGIDAGVDTLMELAGLEGITRASPVTIRLIFKADDRKAELAPIAPETVQLASSLK